LNEPGDVHLPRDVEDRLADEGWEWAEPVAGYVVFEFIGTDGGADS